MLLTIEELQKIQGNYPDANVKFQTFVETGTYKGETILKMEPFFEELHTF